MSYLKVTTRTGEVVRKEFIDMFVAIADGTSDEAAIAMTHIDPIATITTEMSQEASDIQYMAVFMLLTGSQMAYRDQAYGFHFGDVDLMDNYDDWKGWTVMQHELEDTPDFKSVYATLKKVDDDCMRAGEDCIPFSDVEYYAEQVQNIYDLSDEESELMADKLRKFSIFQKSGKDVPDIQKYTDAYGEDPSSWKGRVYLADPTDSCGITIESTEDWDEENKTHAWHLLIENCEWLSDNLEELELILFDWAVSAGWTDDL